MKIVWIVLVLCALLAGCTNAPVVYDEYVDEFRYKPESEWDYANDLGPSDIPIPPTGDR